MVRDKSRHNSQTIAHMLTMRLKEALV